MRKLAWFDTEFTSLDPEDALLLEVALVVTDLDLNELGRESVVIFWTEAELSRAKWDPVARAMHESNGLLDEVRRSHVLMHEAERRVTECLAEHTGLDFSVACDRPGVGSELETAPFWGGCSPWHDRAMLRRYMRRVYERISYRTLDATSLKIALEAWTPESTKRAEKPHRALADVLSAVNLAGRLRDALKLVPEQRDVLVAAIS